MIPDTTFWGMVLPAKETSVVELANEEGLMEMYHLTNVALGDLEAGNGPVQIRIAGPDDEQFFVIGTLVPGSRYSFQTDLLLSPETKFSHTGAGEVHLTGWRYAALRVPQHAPWHTVDCVA